MKWFLPLGEGGAIHKVDEDKLTTKKDGQATSTRSKRRPISIEGVSMTGVDPKPPDFVGSLFRKRLALLSNPKQPRSVA
jgi:hypothetical protein